MTVDGFRKHAVDVKEGKDGWIGLGSQWERQMRENALVP